MVDVVEVLTESRNPSDYIKKMKKRDPEKSIDRAIVDYKRLGNSDEWINQRIKFMLIFC